jgi:N-formylglutamate deformylase
VTASLTDGNCDRPIGFPIVRRPSDVDVRPVLVSIPHYGMSPVPGVDVTDYADPSYVSFPLGYTDRYASDIYGDCERFGATVLATPYSRLFVDVNRRRDDFDAEDGAIASQKGVVKTHTIYDDVVFAAPLKAETVENRLRQYYDPYHRALTSLLAESCRVHERVLLLDAHTASEKGLGRYDVVVSTSRGVTARDSVADAAQAIFEAAGYCTGRDVKGYSGGYIVRSYGRSKSAQIDAVQIEINTALLMTVSRKEMFERLNHGEHPPFDEAVARRLRRCVEKIICAYE